MAAFSLDLRRRILSAALADGAPTEQALADRFRVSRSFVQKLKRRWRTAGTAEPVGHRGGAPLKLSGEDRATLLSLGRRLRRHLCRTPRPPRLGARGHPGPLDGQRGTRRRWPHAQKKTLRAAERDREDVAQERAVFVAEQPSLDGSRLVFLDETGSNIAMARRYARSKRGRLEGVWSTGRSRTTEARTSPSSARSRPGVDCWRGARWRGRWRVSGSWPSRKRR